MQNFSEIGLIIEEKSRKNVLHTYTLKIDYNSPADFVSRAKNASMGMIGIVNSLQHVNDLPNFVEFWLGNVLEVSIMD